MTKKKEETLNEKVEQEVVDNKPVTPSVQMTPEVPDTEVTPEPEAPKKTTKSKKGTPVSERPLEQLVKETIKGTHGSGRERMVALGSRYAEVQKAVHLETLKSSK